MCAFSVIFFYVDFQMRPTVNEQVFHQNIPENDHKIYLFFSVHLMFVLESVKIHFLLMWVLGANGNIKNTRGRKKKEKAKKNSS